MDGLLLASGRALEEQEQQDVHGKLVADFVAALASGAIHSFSSHFGTGEYIFQAPCCGHPLRLLYSQVDLWRWSFDGACWISPHETADNNQQQLTPTQRAVIQQLQHVRPSIA
jgi:hypothetical protein